MKTYPATPRKIRNGSTSSAAERRNDRTSTLTPRETESDRASLKTTPPSTPTKLDGYSTPVTSPTTMLKDCPVINDETELLDILFSAENIRDKDLAERYSNFLFIDNPSTSRKQEMFRNSSRAIFNNEIPFKRYSIFTLDKLFEDYQYLLQQNQSSIDDFPQIQGVSSSLSEQQISTHSLSPDSVSDEEAHERSSSKSDKTSQEISPLKTISCRFVVLSESQGKQNMFLSLYDGADGMSHAQLVCADETTASCISAGVITFIMRESKWFIQSLSNKSGHFMPGPEALLNPLGIILMILPSYLKDNIDLIYHSLPSPMHHAKEQSFTLSVQGLKTKFTEKNILPEPPLYYSGDFPQEYLAKIDPAQSSNSRQVQPPREGFEDDVNTQEGFFSSRFLFFSPSASPQKRRQNPSFTQEAIDVEGAGGSAQFSPRRTARARTGIIEYDSDPFQSFKL